LSSVLHWAIKTAASCIDNQSSFTFGQNIQTLITKSAYNHGVHNDLRTYYDSSLVDMIMSGRFKFNAPLVPEGEDFSTIEPVQYSTAERKFVQQVLATSISSFQNIFEEKVELYLKVVDYLLQFVNSDLKQNQDFESIIVGALLTKFKKGVEYEEFVSEVYNFIVKLCEPDTIPSDPVRARNIAFDCLTVYGFSFGTRDEDNKSKVTWRDDWLELLDKFCEDKDPKIRLNALTLYPSELIGRFTQTIHDIHRIIVESNESNAFGDRYGGPSPSMPW